MIYKQDLIQEIIILKLTAVLFVPRSRYLKMVRFDSHFICFK